jgi:hypothetical protein
MVDVRSPRAPLTVQLPSELIEELEVLAREKGIPIDEVVMEACLAYTEPYTWQRSYKEWRRGRPGEPLQEFGIDGEPIHPPAPNGDRP